MNGLTPFAAGVRACRLGRYAEAIEILSDLAGRKDLPGRLARYYTGISHRAIGIEHMRDGRFAEAGQHFRQAAVMIGKRADLAEYLLVVYARTGEHERCVDEAEVLAQAHADDPTARVRLAQAQWRSGRRPLAIMTLTAALRELGDHAQVHLNLGLLYAADEDYELARDHLERAVECDCTSAKGYYYLGLCEAAEGRFDEALKAHQRACCLAPRDLMYAYQLSVAAAAAAETGSEVTVTFPEHAPQQSSSQIRQLAEYIAAEPDFVKASLALPPCEEEEEFFGVLASVLRTAVACHGDYADLHHLAGRALARLGEYYPARAHARRAVEINPRYADALLHLAELEAQAGDEAAAMRHLNRAVDCGADWPDVHARLGDLARQAGDRDSARSHYRRALELNSDYEHAASRLASLAA